MRELAEQFAARRGSPAIVRQYDDPYYGMQWIVQENWHLFRIRFSNPNMSFWPFARIIDNDRAAASDPLTRADIVFA